MTNSTYWDYAAWLERFNQRSTNSDHYRSLRREVWQSTLHIIDRGEYESISGKVVVLDTDTMDESAAQTVFYRDSRLIPNINGLDYDTKCYVVGGDCLEISRILQLSGFNPAVLNMASNTTPGGGVVGGSGAQEENLFRRTTAFTSLYQFVDFGCQYGVTRNLDFTYPIPYISGGIYSPELIVFRSSEATGYHLLDSPYKMHMISVAAYSHPPLYRDNGQLYIVDDMVEPTKEKIRTILRIGRAGGHDCLVLSAFGCGAFANPPEHMAMLFSEVIAEEEFSRSYKLIVFAIIDDHNARKEHNSEGNLLPFQKYIRCGVTSNDS